MPELPEVETIKRGLENSLVNQKIDHITLHRNNLRKPIPIALETNLENARIIKFTRRGKYILMDLDNNQTVLFHLGMSGKMIVHPYDALTYQRQKHEHFTLLTQEGECLRYIDARRFGLIDLIQTDQKEHHVFLSDMGPEPLPDLNENSRRFHQRMADHFYQKLKNRHQPIKNSLLDQHTVAGLGNIYVCEILFMVGISPLRKSSTLKKKDFLLLAQAMQSILLHAIAVGGSSMRDYVHSDGKKGYFQMHWKVYGKEGENCYSCLQKEEKSVIKRTVQAGRSSFYCDFCQK